MIFVDTSAFLAIENKRDTHHKRAVSFRDHCLKNGLQLITSDHILDESYTIVRFKAGHSLAISFGEDLRRSRLLRIEYVTQVILNKAWHIFKSFADHDFSFTDCVSFAIMEQLHIKTVFSFDAHFKGYGKFLLKP